MTTTLITGANKGLGRETARRLLAAGHDVWVGARNAEAGREAAEALGARFVAIDVTEDANVDAAVQTIRDAGTGLDVLINNAGILGSHAPAEELTGPDAADILNTNVAGIVRVTHAFVPLLRAAEQPAIVNVTSGMGSFTLTHDPERVESKPVAPLYTASKAAVTMLTTQYAKAFADIRVNAVDPGYTATDFNAHSGHQTITEGTDAIVALATEGPDAGTGRFVDRFGPVPW
jgi:NAD(P)-dependent dehydrogenase (short-subunit alcohol dehydrogenase family)